MSWLQIVVAWWRHWFCRLFGRCGPSVVLVRHADYDGGPGDPSLNATGLARRDQLAQVLAKVGVAHIIVSEWARTHQTAATLAADLGLTPEEIPALDLDAIEAAARSHPSTVLIVGHSNTVPELVDRFTSTSDPAPSIEGEFDNLFVVVTGQLIHLQYGAPT
jgi:broad specificity phosphatase PhoE